MEFALNVYPERYRETDGYQPLIEETSELVRMADRGGFDSVFTAEHHTIDLLVAPNPLAMLAHWAAMTERVRLGTAVVTAPYWHPIRLAGEAALVDNLSGGRLELGLGRGAYQYEFDRMAGGIDQRLGGDYLREAVPLLKALWAGDVEHGGDAWAFPKATSVPKPVQQPHPPLWVAARTEGTFDFALAHGCHVMANPFNKPFDEVVALKRRFDEARSRHPESRGVKLLILRRVFVCDGQSDVDVAVEALHEYGRRFENLFQNLGDVRNGVPESVPYDRIANRSDYTREALLENLVIGTPGQVVDKLRRYEELGIDCFAYGASFGLPHDAARRSLELFIGDVMPAFQQGDARAVGPASYGRA